MRVNITLEHKESGERLYLTQKNKRNTPDKLIAKAVTVNSGSNEKNAKTPFSEADFMKTVQDPTFIAKMVKAYPKLFASLPTKDSGIKYQLEGYLFPATYDYTKSSTVESVIENMIQAANTQLTPYYDTIN